MNKATRIILAIILIALMVNAGRLTVNIVQKTIRNEKIMSYNAGYRAGKLEAYAELVECFHDKNAGAIQGYEAMSAILLQRGELDTSPFPCGE